MVSLVSEILAISFVKFMNQLLISPPSGTLPEEGLVALQSLVEGMVLEVHIVGQISSNKVIDDPAATCCQLQTPLVELYTQFGSQVSKVSSHIFSLNLPSVCLLGCLMYTSILCYVDVCML